MTHPALSSGNVAVVTGGASGIGLAAAERFAAMGLKVALADLPGARLDAAADAVTRAGGEALAVPTDVSSRDDLRRLETTVLDRFGHIHVLMNNAGVQPGSSLFDGVAAWEQVLAVNLWGLIHGVQVFVPGHDRARPARPGDQHRLQAGHHHAAGRPRLQRVQGRREGADRGPGARAAQRARVPAHRPPADPGLRLHRRSPPTAGPRSRPPPGRPSRRSTSCWRAWTAATSTSSAPTTTCRASSTSGASCGPPRTSSTTAHPCRAGTRTGRSASRRGSRKA